MEKRSDFHGDRLRLARSIRCYTQKELAERVGASHTTISRLELDRFEPTPGLLAALCEALDVMPSFFEHPVTDEFKLSECSFRHLQSTTRRLLDQALAKGTLFQEIISAFAHLVEFPPTNVPNIPAKTETEIDAAANETRRLWGLSLRAPITNIIQAAEHAGIVVTRLKGTTEKVDAFSRFGNPPVIVLNSVRDSASRDRFNVAHELGHLVIHRGHPTGDSETEREANQFARAFLLPAEVFKDELRMSQQPDWPNLFELKRRWKLPGTELLQRAEHIGAVGAATARSLYKQHSYRRWHKSEPYEMPCEQPEALKIALEIIDREKLTLEQITASLGWGPVIAEEVTGIAMEHRGTTNESKNIAHLEDYRR